MFLFKRSGFNINRLIIELLAPQKNRAQRRTRPIHNQCHVQDQSIYTVNKSRVYRGAKAEKPDRIEEFFNSFREEVMVLAVRIADER